MATTTVRKPILKKQRRGFAAMSAETRTNIARKGGAKVAKNRKHMAEIGAMGGAVSGRARRRARKSGKKA
jgi:general stress protein YciG